MINKLFLNNNFKTNKLIIIESIQLMGIFYISYFLENTFIHMTIFIIILFLIGIPQNYALIHGSNKKFNYYLLLSFFILFSISINLEIYILYEFRLGEFNYIYNLSYGLILYMISIILLKLLLKRINSNFLANEKIVNIKKHKEILNLLNQADELIISGDQKGGIQIFNKILKENPNEISALFGKAQALYQLNKLEESLKIINSYISKDIDKQTKITSYGLMAGIFYKSGDLEKSIIYNNMILEIDPKNETALFNKLRTENKNEN